MIGDTDLPHQLDTLQQQSTETPTPHHSSNSFKSFMFALGIVLVILTPVINEMIDPGSAQRVYSNVPFWYTPWKGLIEASQTVIFFIAFVRKKRLWIYILL